MTSVQQGRNSQGITIEIARFAPEHEFIKYALADKQGLWKFKENEQLINEVRRQDSQRFVSNKFYKELQDIITDRRIDIGQDHRSKPHGTNVSRIINAIIDVNPTKTHPDARLPIIIPGRYNNTPSFPKTILEIHIDNGYKTDDSDFNAYFLAHDSLEL